MIKVNLKEEKLAGFREFSRKIIPHNNLNGFMHQSRKIFPDHFSFINITKESV